MRFSVIVPVYNRPDEVGELLQSLARQTVKDFEVIVVEDGSSTPCEDVCSNHAGILDLHYYSKSNSGPGQSRNYGAARAKGEWLVILDSDVVLSETYVERITAATTRATFAAFGGPDRAHESFTPTQKAISYAMTSFFTTGGIRGGTARKGQKTQRALDKFYPRSYNMGIRSDVYRQLGGFSKMRFGEDIDFSYRIVEAGFQTALLPEAWVWHKRRTDFRKFFRQVYNSGIARIHLTRRHPSTLKPVHCLPAAFAVGTCCCLLLALTGTIGGHGALAVLGLGPLLAYSLAILCDSTLRNRSLRVGLLSVPAAFTQLTGYGLGFLHACLRREEFTAFDRNFYS